MSLVLSILASLSVAPVEARGLDEGSTVKGRLDVRKTEFFDFAAREGDFVRGRVETTSGSLWLDLVDATGAHVRRLALSGERIREFMFIVGSDGERLRLGTNEPAQGHQDYALTITKIVGRTGQTPPQPTFLSQRMSRLAESLATGGATDGFWGEVAQGGSPLVEPGNHPGRRIVTFLWRGAKRNARLFGAPSNDHDWMERLGESDVWFKSYDVPSSTRLSYKIAPDIPDIPGTAGERRRALLATAQADPFNKNAWPSNAPDKYNQDSLLVLSDAPPQPWVEERGAPRGKLEKHRVSSRILGNERDVFVYTPPGAGDTARGLLILFDAAPYMDKVPTPRILDNLIADGKIPPVVAVLIGNPSPETRGAELPCNEDFAAFLANELAPWIRQRVNVAITGDRTIIGGSSYGGLAAAYAAHRHPNLFGNVLSMSGSFWWHPDEGDVEAEWLTRAFAKQPSRSTRFFLSAGLFETGREEPGILETTRHLRDVLMAKGYPVTYRDYAAGHDYIAWRNALVDGLIALFGKS